MAVTLHYLNMSRATRVLWILQELGISYDTKLYFRNPKTRLAPPELSKVHPSGASPLITDDGEVYAESGWILEHLVKKYGAQSDLIWKNEKEENIIKYALYSGESNIMISGFMIGVHDVAVKTAPWGVSKLLGLLFSKIDSYYASPQFEKCMRNLSDQVESNGGYYCNGRFTVADIMYWTSLEQFINFGVLTDLQEKWPVLYEWHKRLEKTTKYLQTKEKEKELEDRTSSSSKL